MRAGFFAALFLSAFALVQAAPSPSHVEERDLIDNLENAVASLFSTTIDLKSIISVATSVVEPVFAEATSIVGDVLQTDTALVQEATSLFAAATSAIGPEASSIVQDAKNVIVTSNGAASRPISMGAAAVLGSMLLGAYAAI
ncbi:hypothetical protein C8Q80DRAFT_1264203 [Daedaleopsis nitida]|nr:hypothetical protein C8Q80DRAFT_1264203 [Daedaleopsis nitida]